MNEPADHGPPDPPPEPARCSLLGWQLHGPTKLSPYWTAERQTGNVREILGGRDVDELLRKLGAVVKAEGGQDG